MSQAAIDRAAVEAALSDLHDAWTGGSLLQHGRLGELSIGESAEGAHVMAELVLGYPAAGIRDERARVCEERLVAVEGIASAKVTVTWEIVAQQTQKNLPHLAEVRNVIAVASGKGGVGKSTTAVNLALALSVEGAKVGILDADIYGPSQGILLGVEEGRRPDILEERLFMPIKAHGLQAMSMSFLTDEDTPMVWRGPMVSGALQQLITQTAWSDLDYLIVDMPPGTGDVQLTLSQRIPVSGAVVVTTPQDIALIDAIKGIEMFRKVDVPVLGIVENMSVHMCSACGHVEHLFGEGGGMKVAERYETTLLGALPLAPAIREQADTGNPTVAADPNHPHAQIYRDMARLMAGRLSARGGRLAPVISITDD